LPDVIKFAYKDLQKSEGASEGEKIPKWSAVCNSCGSSIVKQPLYLSGIVCLIV